MNKGRVLVVDDEKEVCHLIKDMLENKGYEALTAYDGEEGLKKAVAEHPNLVLLDVMLPGIDGFEVLDRLKRDSNTRSLPVLMVSAKRDSDSLFKARDLGSDDYITKPFTVQELLKAVVMYINLCRV